MGGAQAQVLPAAQASIWARMGGLKQEQVERAIWQDRTLSRAWCMRRTLYLLPSKDLAVFVRGSARRAEKEIRWARKNGIPGRKLERVLEAVLDALDEPVTRSELAKRVSRALRLPLREGKGGGWGSERKIPCVQVEGLTFPAYYLLHLAGARGVLCSGPNEGNEATFVRADAWVPGWRDVPVEQAEGELLRRYLRAFGPATVQDFVAWTQMRLSDAQEIWVREEAGFSPVDVEGWSAWVLRRDLRELERADLNPPTIRILPYFDSFLLGHKGREHLVEPRYRRRVYRDQGWVSPVILVDGLVKGTWTHTRKGRRLSVRVEPFERLSRSVSSAVKEESQDLGRFLGCEIVGTRVD